MVNKVATKQSYLHFFIFCLFDEVEDCAKEDRVSCKEGVVFVVLAEL